MTQISFSDSSGVLFRHADFGSQYVAPRHIDVWMPAGSAGTRLPVLYAHDGQNLFDPVLSFSGVDWGIDEAIRAEMVETGLPGAIVVGVWNSDQRLRDYAPQAPLETMRDSEVWQGIVSRAGGEPWSDGYLRFLVEELKPFIDSSYPTLTEPEHTFVMGSSLGGLISLYAVERYPQVFGAAACVSTHWPLGGDALVDAMGAALPKPGHHRLYFDYGTETLDAGYEPFQLRMDGHLRAAGYQEGKDWLTQKFPGAAHSERSWRERARAPLRFLLLASA